MSRFIEVFHKYRFDIVRKSIEIRLTNTNRAGRFKLLDDGRLDWRFEVLEHFRRRSRWRAKRQVIILDHERYAR